MNKLFTISYTIFSLCFPSTLHAMDDILSSFVIKEPTNGKSIEINIPLKNTEDSTLRQRTEDIATLDLSTLLDTTNNISSEKESTAQKNKLTMEEEGSSHSSFLIDSIQSTRSTSHAMENIVEATKEIQSILKRMIPQQENMASTKIISQEEARTAAVLLRSSYLFVLEGLQFCTLNKNLTMPSQDAEAAIDSFISRNSEILAQIPIIFDQTTELTSVEKETTHVFVRDFIQNYFNTNKHCSAHYDDVVTNSVDLKKNNKTAVYTQTIAQFLKQHTFSEKEIVEK
ncbi:MAG: hypothetical protein ACRCV3_05030 [Desulfovibrionaceae bacterium]